MTTDLSKKATWVLGLDTNSKLVYLNNNNGALSPASWGKWGGPGGNTSRYEPFTCHTMDNYVHVFTVGHYDGHLYAKYSPIGSPVAENSNWADLGGVLAGGPVATFFDQKNRKIQVLAVGMDGNVYGCRYSSGWGWLKLPTSSANSPTFQPDKIYSSTDGNGRIDVVAVSTTNGLYHRFYKGTIWSDWTSIGWAPVNSRPFCRTWGQDRVEVVAKGSTDQKLWHTACENGIWFGWQKISDLQTIFDIDGSWVENYGKRLDIAFIDVTGSLYRAIYQFSDGKLGTWSNVDNWGGKLSSSPKVSSRALDGGRTGWDVFARGMDSRIYYKLWDGTKIVDWVGINGLFSTKPC